MSFKDGLVSCFATHESVEVSLRYVYKFFKNIASEFFGEKFTKITHAHSARYFMKILIGGQLFKGSSVNSGVDGFRSLGIEVATVNFGTYKSSILNRIANKFLFKSPHYWMTGAINAELLATAKNFRPDFILLFKPILITPATVNSLRKLSKTFSWYPDYVYFPKTASSYFYQSIPLYDAHFSFNFANSEELKKFGAKESLFLPCAADPALHYRPDDLSPEEQSWGADVIFIGTYAPEDRVKMLERLAAEGIQIKIYGNDWEALPKDSPLVVSGAVQYRPLNCEDMAKGFAASKIAVAFVRQHNKETLACRTYEIPACGTFMLHERTSKTGEVFEEGKEAEFFSSYEELRDKVAYYLTHEEERRRIAEAGLRKILGGGNYFKDRARFILDFYEKMTSRGADDGQ